jgi:hypothetical protein
LFSSLVAAVWDVAGAELFGGSLFMAVKIWRGGLGPGALWLGVPSHEQAGKVPLSNFHNSGVDEDDPGSRGDRDLP